MNTVSPEMLKLIIQHRHVVHSENNTYKITIIIYIMSSILHIPIIHIWCYCQAAPPKYDFCAPYVNNGIVGSVSIFQNVRQRHKHVCKRVR